MRARAAALGAPFEIVRVAERGTRVTLGIPAVAGA
jgi:signal transduction histidine kinase